MTDNTDRTDHTEQAGNTGNTGNTAAPAPGLGSHGWQPTPQGGEYDADATAFVQLPEGFDFSGGTGSPLAAPGHDYVPPHITAPLETGTWNVHLHQEPQPYQPHPHDAQHQPSQPYQAPPLAPPLPPYDPEDRHAGGRGGQEYGRQGHDVRAQRPSAATGWPDAGHDAGATSQWNFTEALDATSPAAPAPGAAPSAPRTEGAPDVSGDHGGSGDATGPSTGPSTAPTTGPSTAPSGEGTPGAPAGTGHTSTGPVIPATAWPGSGAPATLPGGAPAPWALPAAQPAGPAESAGPADASGASEGPQDSATGTPAAGTHLPAPGSGTLPDASPAFAPEDVPAVSGAATDGSEAAEASGVSEPEPEPRPEPEPAEVSATAADGADSTDGDPETDGTPEATAAESGAETGADAEAGTEAAAAPDALNALTGEAAAAGPGTDGYGTEHGPGTGFAPSPESGFEPSYAAPHEPAPFHDAPSEHPSASYVLRVNGADRPVTDAWIGESLLYVLRERLGLAGAKDGCSQGECGACAVQVDGRLVASCLVPAATTAGSEVRTVEGLATDGEPSDVQRALANCGAVQCGFCIPGMAMTVHDLLEGNHAPTELETRQALCGNLCRCSGYRGVLEAVRDVVAEREASAEAAATGHTPDEARIPHQAPPGAGSAQHTLHHPHDGGMA